MDKKRLSINLVATLIQFVVSLIISFYFTPFIISNISKEAYGLFSIAGSMISYITLLTVALNSMASRFIGIEWHKGNYEKANEYFNTTFFSNIGMSGILVVVSTILIVFLNSFLKIPPEILVDVKILFGLVFLSAIITTVMSVFNSATFCTNRLDLKSIVTISTSLIRVLVLGGLFMFFKPNVYYLGVSAIIVVVIESIFSIAFLKKLMSKIKISFKYYKKNLVKTLISSGIWNTVNQLNMILLTGIDVLMANMVLSPSLAGIIAVSKTIPSAIYSLSSMIASVFLPDNLKLYAKGDMRGLKEQYSFSFNVIGVFSSIVLAGFTVLGMDFYRLWLPEEDGTLIYILSLLNMLQIFFEGSIYTIMNISVLKNKIKIPSIVTSVKAVVGVIVTLLLVKFTSIGIYAIAGVSSVLGVLFIILFSVPYHAKLIGFSKSFFYRAQLKYIINVLINIAMFSVVKLIFAITNWRVFFLVALLCSGIALIINFFYYLNKEQRNRLINKFRKKH